MRLAALILALAVFPAQAEVYKWVDEKGRTHYSNAPPDSVADRLKPVEGRISVMGMDPAVRASAERRFAQMSERDARELEGLGPKVMALATVAGQQQSLSPTTHYSYADGYYPGYYPYYGGAVVGRGARVSHHRHSHRHHRR
jgi:hypothetical protein